MSGWHCPGAGPNGEHVSNSIVTPARLQAVSCRHRVHPASCRYATTLVRCLGAPSGQAGAVRPARVWPDVLSLQRAGGEQVPVLLDAAPITNGENGEIQGAVVVFQDITLLKQIDRLRAEWNTVIAHDLRQPLNAISLNAQLIARRKGRRSGCAAGTDRELSAAPQPHDRRPAGSVATGGPAAYAQSLAHRPGKPDSGLRRAHRRRGSRARLRPADSAWPTCCPVSMLIALLRSWTTCCRTPSVRRTREPDRGRCRPAAARALIAVSNYGAGIPSGDLPHLFRRFARVGVARHGHIRASAWASTSCSSLVEAHGACPGREHPGEKTTFRFSLPSSPS